MLMLIGLSCFGQKSFNRFRVKALDTASVQVNQGFTSISTMNIAYSGTSIVYVKFYDSYAKPVLSSATPVITLQLGTSAAISPKSLENYADVNFTDFVSELILNKRNYFLTKFLVWNLFSNLSMHL